QVDVHIVFDPRLVALRDAPALKGDFTPEHALDTVLANTDLTYHLKDTKTIEIAQAVDEIVVKGRQNKLSALRMEYVKLEDRFYAKYNKLNTDHQWDVNCNGEAATGTRLKRRVCTPVFVDRITSQYFTSWMQDRATADP